jgi:hypothetical protein
MSDLENFTPKLTADGSFTFVSQEFGESFHSHYGAQQESFFKFVEPTHLATAAQNQSYTCLAKNSDLIYFSRYSGNEFLQAK